MNNLENKIHIAIGIPTYKRPKGLRILLESLAQMKISSFHISIIVADNEGEGDGSLVAKEMQNTPYPFPIKIVPVKERGISQARNALMQIGFNELNADYIAMVDDDERVDNLWIEELYDMQKKTGADVVGGYVISEFESNEFPWMKELSVFHRTKFDDGPIEIIRGTTAVLISKNILSLDGFTAEFDPRFSTKGGGDEDFFTRAKASGGHFAFTSRAISYELFPTSRMNKIWAVRRSFRTGSSYANLFRKYGCDRPFLTAIKEILKLFSAFLYGILLIILFFWSPKKYMKGVLIISRQTGKIFGFFGYELEEYKKIHGT